LTLWGNLQRSSGSLASLREWASGKGMRESGRRKKKWEGTEREGRRKGGEEGQKRGIGKGNRRIRRGERERKRK